MYMPYSKNPQLPKVRMQAVNLVYQGWSMRKVARYFGFGSGTVSKWMRRDYTHGRRPIPTRSSRPHAYPHALRPELVAAVIAQRKRRQRCAEVIHYEILSQGMRVSLSSVKRVLARHGLIRKRSPWKRWHFSVPRPEAEKPGDLVQIDTIHIGPHRDERLYVYTLLDVTSRWANAMVSLRINTHQSLRFLHHAQTQSPFRFSTLQSDHGQEFSTYFTEQVKIRGAMHRHSRVRQPNDNAHLERFNRTLQDECLKRIPQTLRAYQREIPEYLHYYNHERPHLGLGFKTPAECVQAID